MSHQTANILASRHNAVYDWFFNRYIQFILKKDFESINVVGEWNSNNESSMVIGNHVSWWDGFWAYYLNKRFLKKRFHVMMLEDQLKSRPFFCRIGAFSIKPGRRSVMDSLNYAVEKLKDHNNLVLFYPQGRIASSFAGVLPFNKGLDYVVKKAGNKQIQFYAAFTDYLSNRKPTLTIYLKNHVLESISSQIIESAYRYFYNESLQKQSLITV
jgi:1-acyl-sn-glycerol-3-phosphate acyltransferase